MSEHFISKNRLRSFLGFLSQEYVENHIEMRKSKKHSEYPSDLNYHDAFIEIVWNEFLGYTCERCGTEVKSEEASGECNVWSEYKFCAGCVENNGT